MKKIVFIKDFINAYCDNAAGFAMSPERQRRAEMLFSNREQHRFITAERITLDLIQQCFGIDDAEICGMVSQKPYIRNHPDLCFSRSYCGDDLCVAVEDAKRIGVDCERIDKADASVMKYFFTDSEKIYVKRSPDPDLAFSLIWTRKESYIKCIGDGLRFRLDLLDVTPEPSASAGLPVLLKNDKLGDLYIKSYITDGAVVSVCSEIEDTFPMCIQEWRNHEENDH